MNGQFGAAEVGPRKRAWEKNPKRIEAGFAVSEKDKTNKKSNESWLPILNRKEILTNMKIVNGK